VSILAASISILILVIAAYLLLNLIKSIAKTALIISGIALVIYVGHYFGLWEYLKISDYFYSFIEFIKSQVSSILNNK
jgi:hypothetical protein